MRYDAASECTIELPLEFPVCRRETVGGEFDARSFGLTANTCAWSRPLLDV
jgi:hypothetical protein